MKYRAEIDGLRAISILAVILYHSSFFVFGYNFFKGGFIGVDIFFVISGYLITRLILKEIHKTNKFSFIQLKDKIEAETISKIISFFIVLDLSR